MFYFRHRINWFNQNKTTSNFFTYIINSYYNEVFKKYIFYFCKYLHNFCLFSFRKTQLTNSRKKTRVSRAEYKTLLNSTINIVKNYYLIYSIFGEKKCVYQNVHVGLLFRMDFLLVDTKQ